MGRHDVVWHDLTWRSGVRRSDGKCEQRRGSRWRLRRAGLPPEAEWTTRRQRTKRGGVSLSAVSESVSFRSINGDENIDRADRREGRLDAPVLR